MEQSQLPFLTIAELARLIKTQNRQANDAKNLPASSGKWQEQRKAMKREILDDPLEGL